MIPRALASYLLWTSAAGAIAFYVWGPIGLTDGLWAGSLAWLAAASAAMAVYAAEEGE